MVQRYYLHLVFGALLASITSVNLKIAIRLEDTKFAYCMRGWEWSNKGELCLQTSGYQFYRDQNSSCKRKDKESFFWYPNNQDEFDDVCKNMVRTGLLQVHSTSFFLGVIKRGKEWILPKSNKKLPDFGWGSGSPNGNPNSCITVKEDNCEVHEKLCDKNFYAVCALQPSCLKNNGGCDEKSTVCTMSWGIRRCVCKPGFNKTSGTSCKDIDECVSTTRCPKDSGCVNTQGGFQCTCKDGYEIIIHNDKIKCVDIDECASWNGHCSQTCINKDGGYTCECAAGFTAVGKECQKKSIVPILLTSLAILSVGILVTVEVIVVKGHKIDTPSTLDTVTAAVPKDTPSTLDTVTAAVPKGEDDQVVN